MLNEIKGHLKQKNILSSWNRRLNIVKMSVQPKIIYSVQFLSKFQLHILQKYINPSRNSYGISNTLNSQTVMKKKNIVGEQRTLSDLKTYYKAIIIKTVQCSHKDRYIHQWNGVESLDINSCIYCQMILHEDAKTIQLGKDILFFFSSFFLFLPAPVACRTFSSSTRDLTHALCSESTDSYPLDCQESPQHSLFNK